MTTMEDVRTATEHEIHLDERWVRTRSKWLTPTHWVDIAVTGLLWIPVVLAASGLGQLLEAIYDTVRYGHPR